MKNDSSVVAITSGTPTVMGFTEDKRKEAGSQFVDEMCIRDSVARADFGTRNVLS